MKDDLWRMSFITVDLVFVGSARVSELAPSLEPELFVLHTEEQAGRATLVCELREPTGTFEEVLLALPAIRRSRQVAAHLWENVCVEADVGLNLLHEYQGSVRVPDEVMAALASASVGLRLTIYNQGNTECAAPTVKAGRQAAEDG